VLEGIKEKYQEALAVVSQEFTPEGFTAFFELMHVIPLHSAGLRWVDEAFRAHEEGRGFLNKAHRESAKTTVFSKFFLAFFIGQINDDKANETTQAVANIIKHDPRWKMVFPHVEPDEQKGWGAQGYEVKRTDISYQEWTKIKTGLLPDPTFVGYGWKSGSIIGSRINGVFIGDDIHDESNTSSERQLRSVKKWYTDTMSPCLMEGAWELWNYTPWLENDLYAYLENTGAYNLVVTPVIVRGGDEKWPEHEMVPLSGLEWERYWPEAWSWERLSDKYMKAGPIGFARMYQLDLEATKGLNLKAEWIRKYPASEIDPSWPVFMGVDYASTADKLVNKDRDYFALALARAIPGGGLVVFDGYREKISKGEALEVVASYANMYPNYRMIGVESIGKGEEYYNDLVFMNDVNGRPLKLFPINYHEKSKGKRFEEWLAPRCNAGRIWFSNVENSFLRAFYDEWLSYPNGKHDDTLDAVYMCALAGEGFLPSKAERALNYLRKEQINPYKELLV
jgi:phage terminase large subunit-like protein